MISAYYAGTRTFCSSRTSVQDGEMPGFFAKVAQSTHTGIGVRQILTLVLLGLSLPVRAWSGEPLCALEPAPLLSMPLSSEAPHPAPMCMPVLRDPTGARDLGPATARETWRVFRELGASDPEAALLRIPLLEAALPRLADVFALHRGDLLLRLARPQRAEAAYRVAFERSIDSEVLVRARVGRVRALIAMGHRDATNALTNLKRRYPELPEEPQIELELAQMRERQGKLREALRTYRRLDLRHPGSIQAARARTRLQELLEDGVRVQPLSLAQRVERMERLARRGPLDRARTEIAALMQERRLPPALRARVYVAAARLARHEGRWGDAEALLRRAQGTGALPGDPNDRARLLDRTVDLARAVAARRRDVATRQLRQLRAGRTLPRIATGRLRLMGRIAARAGLDETVDAIAEELHRRNLPPALRLRSALELTGAASDERILALLDGLHELAGSLGVKAAYHRARTLQRLGRWAEAELALLDVVVRDNGPTPFYGMWAKLQLDEVRASMVGACGPLATCTPPAAPRSPSVVTTDAHASERADSILADSALTGVRTPREGLADRFIATQIPPRDIPRALALLEPIAKEHDDAYPWLGRAEDFLRLGEADLAGRQLYEAFLAWREATGRAIRRCGRESVARGSNRGRRFLGFALKRDRRALDANARRTLSEVGALIGDYGVSVGFGGWEKVSERPRAYADLVETAAARHGLDPNLLFAVMRVESVYQKEIVSYAGAIGLCQIMPRTGQLIAHALGRGDFTSADLLEAETNLDFAAWYLRSLIDRFDGRLPLAIASYNGGPHNVRRWMADQPERMPLDVFLEHIPFDQTHRYVRRVLTHYRAYRAQQGLPMVALTTDLPTPRTDPIAF